MRGRPALWSRASHLGRASPLWASDPEQTSGSTWGASSGPASSAGRAEQEAGLARVAALGAAAFLSLKRQDKAVPSGAWHLWGAHAFWHLPESAPLPWNPDNWG